VTARLTVTYGLDADAYLTARAVDKALEGHHVHVSVEKTESGDMAPWLVERGDPKALGYWFLPGEQLVVTFDDGWRIDEAAGPEVAA
jgi:hypothetical protein